MDWIKGNKQTTYLFFMMGSLFLTTSCHYKVKETPFDKVLTTFNQELVLGEWYPLDSMPVNLNGYRFMADNLCENHLGFYQYVDPVNGALLSHPETWGSPDTEPLWLNNVIRSYGNQSVYEIRNDLLRIFDPALSDWAELRIEFHSEDTLIMHSLADSISETYIRKIYPVEAKPLVEEICFYYPHTYFADEIYFQVKRTGEFRGKGVWDRGFSRKMMDKGMYEQIEHWFKMADQVIPLAELHYAANADRKMIYKRVPQVTFLLDGKMSTLNRPFDQVPFTNREFYWAFFSALFLPDYIHLVPCYWHHPDARFSSGIWYDYTTFEFRRNDSSGIQLFPSEDFYLCSLLLDAKPTTRDFVARYGLKGIHDPYKDVDIEDIETDGRYFRYTSDGYLEVVRETLDIGFNFIEENRLEKEE